MPLPSYKCFTKLHRTLHAKLKSGSLSSHSASSRRLVFAGEVIEANFPGQLLFPLRSRLVLTAGTEFNELPLLIVQNGENDLAFGSVRPLFAGSGDCSGFDGHIPGHQTDRCLLPAGQAVAGAPRGSPVNRHRQLLQQRNLARSWDHSKVTQDRPRYWAGDRIRLVA